MSYEQRWIGVGGEDLAGLVNILLWPFEEVDGFPKDEKEKLLVVKKSL